MIESLPENEIKIQALIDNTAQGIFNFLKEIENKREIYEKRWIWELLQNSLDSAPADRKIEVEIIKNDNQLTFMHNGRPFKPEEVAHLIYHGSTKREQEIGKFGTGFLITHLLSRQVNVRGVRQDGKKFEFILDRDGASFEEIKELMEKTWDLYQESLKVVEEGACCTAEYEYPLNNISLSTVEAGVRELTKIAPYVLAFNDKIGAIKITDQTHKVEFELVNEVDETTCVNKVVKEEEEGKPPTLHELWIAKDDDVEIAIRGKKQGDETCQVESLQGIPKIFLAFPLFGTQDLPFPVVVNSRKFEPTDKRDGIFLGREDTEEIKRNKRLLEKASKLFSKMIFGSDFSEWVNIHTLLSLGIPPEKDWLDKDWYIGLLKKLIDEIINARVLKTENVNFIPLKEGFIPVVEGFEKEKVDRLWDLCCCFLAYKDRIPLRGFTFEWADIFKGWGSLGLNLTEREITIEKLAEEIERCGSLLGFKAKLDADKDELSTLNDFYKLLLDIRERELLDDKSILPDQNGNFKKEPGLFRDEGIDETLKDISNKLGEDVRNLLLHFKISEYVQNLLSVKKQDEILNQLVALIKKQPRPDDRLYLQANIELFDWLLEHDKFEHLEGYPLLSSKEKTFAKLSTETKDKLLAPKNVWNETAKIYVELFPEEFIISSSYSEKVSQSHWQKLENNGMVLADPLYKEKEKVSGRDLDSLLLSDERLEEGEHEIIEEVELSKIAFLETKDKGIIDSIRTSKEKARKFLGFLFDFVIEYDTQWHVPTEVNCVCGSKHKMYTAFWIKVLKDREWVPVGRGKEEKLNSQCLASLLEKDKNLQQKCVQDKPSLLLSILDVSVGEVMMYIAAKDVKTKHELSRAMGSLYSTFMENPNQLNKIAQLAESEPELFIKEIEERIYTREQIRRNQLIGSLVETLLKSVLEKEGFKVEITGVGSDFAVEHDFVKDDIEQILKIEKEEKTCFYLEVKSAYQEFIKMTLTQAKEARDKSDKYALCVVKLDGLEINEQNVKNSARFVIDIGQKIRDKVSKAENLKEEREALAEIGDIEIEISEGPIRLKINKRVWEDSYAIEQFLAFLGCTKN